MSLRTFLRHILSTKVRSEEGISCGIVGCDNTDLHKCELPWYDCANSYCTEHQKIHFHAKPEAGDNPGCRLRGIAWGGWWRRGR